MKTIYIVATIAILFFAAMAVIFLKIILDILKIKNKTEKKIKNIEKKLQDTLDVSSKYKYIIDRANDKFTVLKSSLNRRLQ
jgi:hypothetical protein